MPLVTWEEMNAASETLPGRQSSGGADVEGPIVGRQLAGNIDLKQRPRVANPDGSISTVKSMSIGTGRGEVLIPQVSDDGRVLTSAEAIAQYERTGKHLGIFDTPETATAYAQALHAAQEQFYAQPPAAPEKDYSLLDLSASAWRQNNIVSNWYEQAFNEPTIPEPVAGYVPEDDMKGFEQHWRRLNRAKSPIEMQVIKDRIRQESADREAIRQAGAGGLALSLAAGATDPFTLVAMAVPVAPALAGASRAARIGAGVAASVAVDSTAEFALHQAQELRTVHDSAVNIGVGALLTGALGTFATRVPKAEFEKARTDIAAELATPDNGGSVGAARVAGTTLEDETIARGGEWLAKTVGRISPITRLMTSPEVKTRQIAQELAAVPYALNKNLRGEATAQSVEAASNQRRTVAEMQIISNYDELYREYRKREGSKAVSQAEFGEEAFAAMNREDKSSIPEAAQLAARTRTLLDEHKAEMIQRGVPPEEFDLLGTAKSYAPWVHDQSYVEAYRTRFEGILRKWFKENPKFDQKLAESSKQEADKATKDLGFARAKEQSEGQKLKEAESEHDSLQTSLTDVRRIAVEVRRKRILASREEKRTSKAAASARKLAERRANVARSTRIVKKIQERMEKKLTRVQQELAALPADDARRGKLEDLSSSLEQMLEKHRMTAEARTARAAKRAEDTRRAADEAERQYLDAKATRKAISEEVRTSRKKLAEMRKLRNDAAESMRKARELANEAMRELKSAQNAAEKATSEAERLSKPDVLEDYQIEEAVQDTLDNIMGTVRGNAIGFGPRNPSPFKARTLDLPYELRKEFLVHDFEHVMRGYLRTVIPNLEVRKRFGSITLDQEITDIKDAYRAKLEKATSDRAKKQLSDAMKKDIENFEALRDRVLNQVGPTGNDSLRIVRLHRLARAYNYTRLLGGQTLSSLTDAGRLVARYGLARTGAATAKFLTNINANRISRQDAQKFGTAVEWVLDSRASTFSDVGDELISSKMDKFASKADRFATRSGQLFTRISGMATWNSSLKAIAAGLEQDAMLRIARKGNPSELDLAKFAQNGIGKSDLKALQKQLEKYGEEESGLLRARTELWDDQALAKKFEAAVVAAADQVVLTRGAGDLPIFMNKEFYKTLLQFKSFGMAAVNRLMIPMSQGLARGDIATANGMAVMLGMGAMTYWAKEKAAGREPDLSNDRVLLEAINWSGMLGFLPDIYDPVAGVMPWIGTPHPPRFSRYSDRTPIESLLGPSLGTASDLYAGAAGLTDRDITQKDIHAFRKILPFQNLFYFRRGINALEGEVGEALDAEGNQSGTFMQRVMREEQVKK